MKKIVTYLRYTTQLIFLILLISGTYFTLQKIILLLVPLSLIIGNYFCGWICPFGTFQEIFSTVGYKIFKKKYKMPEKIQRYLQFSRYILFPLQTLGLFALFFKLTNSSRTLLITDLSNIFISSSTIVMFLFLIISLLFERPYCNYFCLEGNKFSIFSIARIYTIKRDHKTCIQCGCCDNVCPMNISISNNLYVKSTQCINCFKCISLCPVDKTLTNSKI